MVEDKDTSILIDAGKSGRELEARAKKLGKNIENVDGILITHAHSDHIQGAGILSRRYNIPIYITKPAFYDSKNKLGNVSEKIFTTGTPFKIKNLVINPVQTSHSVDSCGFVIDKFGLFTDTGTVTRQMTDIFPKLKGLLLESNHDIDMVIKGPYPYHLKNWILSDVGHLNNIDASHLIQDYGKNLDFTLLGHLSGMNNTEEMVKKTFETLVKRKINYEVCDRNKETGIFNI